MTKSQINKLGEKLRTASELDADSLSQLQQFRASYDEPMHRAQTLLSEVRFEATSRLKTINTIIEKLRRERTRLAEMRDIGGLRIVSEVDLNGQDTIVNRIVDKLPFARVIDRRKSPNYGYRAVHVIAMISERPIEIQVRTQLQDLWAQAIERLADEVGREIRYGGVPLARSEDVENLLKIAQEIAQAEINVTKLNQMKRGLPRPERAPRLQRELRFHFAEVQSIRTQIYEREVAIRAMLQSMMSAGGVSR
jgi:ppGpp synthetase/RelA/SpoT-type nucleotidyltranferase